MLIGYARVSKADGSQSLDLQRDALQAAGVEAGHVYHDCASGVRDDRPGLDSCLRALRTGDVLVVWTLDRLGRTLAHLVNTVQDLSTRGVGPAGAHRARRADRHHHHRRRPPRVRHPPARCYAWHSARTRSAAGHAARAPGSGSRLLSTAPPVLAPATDGAGVLVAVRQSKTNPDGDTADLRYLKNGAARAVRTLRAHRTPAGATGPAPTARVVPLTGQQIGQRFTAAAAAGIARRVTAHSGRVGLASELTARGASTTAVMLAGNWKTARMVGHYSAGATAERGAVATYL